MRIEDFGILELFTVGGIVSIMIFLLTLIFNSIQPLAAQGPFVDEIQHTYRIGVLGLELFALAAKISFIIGIVVFIGKIKDLI